MSLTKWCLQAPQERYALGIFPTPIHRWHPPGVPDGVEMWIKRDDLSGMQLSGNKVCLWADLLFSLVLANPRSPPHPLPSLPQRCPHESPVTEIAVQVRKLEFLLAEVVAKGYDCVITIGGIQSNHCRATAIAARCLCPDDYLYLPTYLVCMHMSV